MDSSFKRFSKAKDADDEDYFNASDEDEEIASKKAKKCDEDEEDELEAFMSGINEQAKQDISTSKEKGEHAVKTGQTLGGRAGIRDDIENPDEQESYFK